MLQLIDCEVTYLIFFCSVQCVCAPSDIYTHSMTFVLSPYMCMSLCFNRTSTHAKVKDLLRSIFLLHLKRLLLFKEQISLSRNSIHANKWALKVLPLFSMTYLFQPIHEGLLRFLWIIHMVGPAVDGS